MNEEIIEKLAQLQYENARLLDELNHLKEHTFSIEEAFSTKCFELSEEKKKTKSLELQNNNLFQVIKEKDFLIDSLEHEKKNLKKLHTKLSSENLSLKGELLQEKLKSKQIEILKTEVEELKNAYDNIKKENQGLILELSVKSDECLSNTATIKECLLHIKELENEKAELIAIRDTLLIQKEEERLKTSENLESLLRKSPEWSKSQMNLFAQVDHDLSSNKDVNNLREEILEVELREKQKKIGKLESLLQQKEEKELKRKKAITELKKELNNLGLLNYNPKVDLRLDLSSLYNIYSRVLDVINWPEGQSGECKPLADVATLSVIVKDGVQTTQPSSVRIIETVSIASQTDPIKNLSPVLPFKTFEKLHLNLDLSQPRSDSDDEEEESLPFIEKDKMQKSLQLFSEPKNCNLDMDMYRMSKRSDSPVSDGLDGSSLDLSAESFNSDTDPDNSRDVNLNLKNFTDSNLFGTELENKSNKNDEYDINWTSQVEILNSEFHLECKNQRTEAEKANSNLKLEINLQSENSIHLPATKKNSVPLTISSTPKAESAEPHALCNLFSVSTNSSSAETENEGQTYLVAKTALHQRTSLTNEEINKKFQDLSFAFKTDSMTIQERLQLMKRRRDQAESNVENELRIIKAKLKNLQYLGLNSEYVNLMADLKKQLDFVLKATVQLSSSAEGYGYAQHEERLLELVAIMLQHVENVESSKKDSSDKGKEKNKRSAAITFDNVIDDDKILRRRSVATITLEGNSRRRASIATLPRVGYLVLEDGNSEKGSQLTPIRTGGNAVKKLSFSQPSSRTHSNGLSGIDDSRRDSTGTRLRSGSKSSEGSMKNVNEFREQQFLSLESELVEESIDSDSHVEINSSSLHLRQLFGSVNDIRDSSSAQEHVNVAYILRRIIELNKLVISSIRFRWPENVLQYTPFYLTWYVVFILTFVFIGGLFTGINGCFTYSCLKYSALWFAAYTFFSFTRRFYRVLIPLYLSFAFAIILFLFWLSKILIPQLSHEEIDSLFRTLGLEIRYFYGPPPV